MYKTTVIHMFHTCNTCVYPTIYHMCSNSCLCNISIYSIYALHVYTYMCNTSVYPTHVLHR